MSLKTFSRCGRWAVRPYGDQLYLLRRHCTGACILEKHLLTQYARPDISCSMDPAALSDLIVGAYDFSARGDYKGPVEEASVISLLLHLSSQLKVSEAKN